MSNANIEFNIGKVLSWRIKPYGEWQKTFNMSQYFFNLSNKSFVLAMLLCKIINENKDIEHEISMLIHHSGCLYEAYTDYMGDILLEKLPVILEKYDITVEKKRCYHKLFILGFELGKKYTSQYRKNLITTWKLQGLI